MCTDSFALWPHAIRLSSRSSRSIKQTFQKTPISRCFIDSVAQHFTSVFVVYITATSHPNGTSHRQDDLLELGSQYNFGSQMESSSITSGVERVFLFGMSQEINEEVRRNHGYTAEEVIELTHTFRTAARESRSGEERSRRLEKPVGEAACSGLFLG